jgi:tRNA (guanine-N7-)-methyltransferase
MKKATKRLTSTYFMERYRHFLQDQGIIHVKTDSPFMFTYTKLMVEKNELPLEAFTEDLYHTCADTSAASDDAHASSVSSGEQNNFLKEIQTYYEQMWLERGFSIKYLRFRLPHEGTLSEPDVEIPVDGYRSYNHEVRSTKKTGK